MNYKDYSQQRENLQNEVQKTTFKPLSFEVFKKDSAEKEQLKHMKRLIKYQKIGLN